MYDYIFFDLDGTLTDSKEGITKSVAYALEKFQISVANLDDLIPFVGPPLVESFCTYYQFSEAKAEQAVAYYREYFSQQGMYENAVYPGIPVLLEALQAKGKKLYVATSKPTYFAKQIIDYFSLTSYFTAVVGSELDGSRIHKADVIAAVLETLPPEAKAQAVMVGDRLYDIAGAQKMGIAAIGVLYGFGDRAELEAAGAKTLAASVGDLGALLLR
ncbi:MAG: HAD family hydrolase [Sporomusaceae bacterium]|nr:HAD family hydrolase [Sporomusaceae bacterium]